MSCIIEGALFALRAGKHYKVTMTDEKRTCQCVDHRIRKHDCKHIRLLLQTMGISDSPGEWFSAAQRLVTSQAANVAAAGPEAAGPAAPRSSKRTRAAFRPTTKQQPGQAFL